MKNLNYEIWDIVLYNNGIKDWTWEILHISERQVKLKTIKWTQKFYKEDIKQLVRKWRNIKHILETEKLEMELFWKIL